MTEAEAEPQTSKYVTYEEVCSAQAALISKAQAILTDYLIPDGLNADRAIERLLYLLDGPEQRHADDLRARASVWRDMADLPRDAVVNIAVERKNGQPMAGHEMRLVYPAYIDEGGTICDSTTANPEPGFDGPHFRTIAWAPLPNPALTRT